MNEDSERSALSRRLVSTHMKDRSKVSFSDIFIAISNYCKDFVVECFICGTHGFAYRNLCKFLLTHTNISRKEALLLWKSLFYSMWMADKPKVQRELAAKLSMLLRCLSKGKQHIWIAAFYETIFREWHVLDKNRINKFLLLLRIFQAELFRLLIEYNWDESSIKSLNKCLVEDGPLQTSIKSDGVGVVLHYFDTFLVELRETVKAFETDEVSPQAPVPAMLLLLQPFFKLAFDCQHKGILQRVHQKVFRRLMTNDIPLESVKHHIQSQMTVRKDSKKYNLHLMRNTLRNINNRSRNNLASGCIAKIANESNGVLIPNGGKSKGVKHDLSVAALDNSAVDFISTVNGDSVEAGTMPPVQKKQCFGVIPKKTVVDSCQNRVPPPLSNAQSNGETLGIKSLELTDGARGRNKKAKSSKFLKRNVSFDLERNEVKPFHKRLPPASVGSVGSELTTPSQPLKSAIKSVNS